MLSKVTARLLCLFLGTPSFSGEILTLPSPSRNTSLSLEQRSRYEVLDGQYRLDGSGGDHALAFRTLLRFQADFDPVSLILEGIDARQALANGPYAANVTLVDTLDLLQGHLAWRASPPLQVRAGRITLDLGSRRLIARNAFRNTINAFTGIDATWQTEASPFQLHAFYLLPVQHLPHDTLSLQDNQSARNREDSRRQFSGLWTRVADLPLASHLEFYSYGLYENPGRLLSRRIQTTGTRLARSPAAGTFDFEFETAFQWGQSRLTPNGNDLDHRASFAHASVGFTLDLPSQPHLQLAYDYASGDSDPDDDKNERFDTLFGARRFEFGPTNLYGAIGRSNLRSPEFRLTLRPKSNVIVKLAHRGVWLDAPRSAWATSGVNDPTGASGRHIGQQLEASVAWSVLPHRWDLEAGFAHLFAGGFLKNAPNATGQGDISYGYLQTTLKF